MTNINSPRASGCIWFSIRAFLFSVLVGNCASADILQCYRCSVTVEKYYFENRTILTPLCSKFEESEEYVVNCPYSSMCLKTISILHLQNGKEQQTVTRGCAQQKNTTQIFRNKQWEQEHLVQEVYDVGCNQVKGNNLAGSTNIHCYCRGNLCNSSNVLGFDSKLSIVILVFLFFYSSQFLYHTPVGLLI